MKNKIKVGNQCFSAFSWFTGWLFAIGFLNLPFFWKGVLAIILWPYYIGEAIHKMIF